MSTTYPDLNTSFPDSIQTFPEMLDITVSDAPLVAQYQTLMQQGNFTQANQVLATIPDVEQKALTNDLLNMMGDTTVALERSFGTKFGPFYIVSEEQPSSQATGDLWFQVVNPSG